MKSPVRILKASKRCNEGLLLFLDRLVGLVLFFWPIIWDCRLCGVFSIGNGCGNDGRATGPGIDFWSANLAFGQVVFSEGRVVLEPQLELIFPSHMDLLQTTVQDTGQPDVRLQASW